MENLNCIMSKHDLLKNDELRFIKDYKEPIGSLFCLTNQKSTVLNRLNFGLLSTLLLFFLTISAYASIITVNEIYTADAVIYPFSSGNPIHGLNFSGHVELNSETSLIRIVLQTQDGQKFMLYEAYPLITSSLSFDVSDICDETCYLNNLIPTELIIEIIDAQVEIDYLNTTDNYVADAETLQWQEKRNNDQNKIAQLTVNIPEYGFNWIPGDNGVVQWYYYQKTQHWGEKYNLLGYDYYSGGIYEAPGATYATITDNNYVNVWDWRNRHSANNPLSPYWDYDDLCFSGWLTLPKDQGNICGACSVFGTLGSLESTINLYYNQHVNLDLSEQHLISCIPEVSCAGGGLPEDIYPWILQNNVVWEPCYPYLEADGNCNNVCTDPEITVTITGYEEYNNDLTKNWDDVQLMLLEKGPLTWIKEGNHVVTLVGWIYDESNEILNLIYKENLGTTWGYEGTGFGSMPAPDNYYYVGAANVPIVNKTDPPTVLLKNEDGDVCDNWGIGPAPTGAGPRDCDDTKPNMTTFLDDYSCNCSEPYYPSVPDNITTEIEWNEDFSLEHPTYIKDGGKLTITCTVFIHRLGKIIVEPGGQLIIDGGKLTKTCYKFWKGIEVWGNDQLPQLNTSTPDNPYSNQGYMSIKNNGQIEYAEIGVLVGATDDNGDFVYEKAGGVLSASESKFKNNKNGVYFLPYYDDQYYVNSSRFYKSTFETNDEELMFFIPEAHLTLNDVYGIIIRGCSFSYVEQPFILSEPEKRGTGILVTDASVYAFPVCLNNSPPQQQTFPCQNSLPCTFDNLRYGIKAFNTGANRLFMVKNAVFNENIAGIYLSGYNQAEVVSSDFNIRLSHPDYLSLDNQFYGGIYLDECSGYHIEGNEFHSNYGPNTQPHIYRLGIYIKDSGLDDNEIYNNVFHNMDICMIAEGVNRGEETGLTMKCNTMYDNGNDIFVVTDPLRTYESRNIGIKEAQGADSNESEYLAGNTFSNWFDGFTAINNMLWNYRNDADNITYYHHLYQYYPLTVPLEDNYTPATITLDENTDIPFVKSVACPSRIGGGDLRGAMDIAENEINSFTAQLNSLTDGGDTDEMNDDVTFSTPPEGFELRQQLLDDSPYLSDTVMQSAIDKEDVLPNSMVRDILVANPQAGKSNEILDAAENRQGMPGYMMNEILQGQQVLGAKELLESKLAHWNNERERALNGLARSFMADTLILNPFDSLIALYQNEGEISSRYRLAFAYRDNDQLTDALNEIDDISVSFELTAFQSAIQSDYVDYFTVLQYMENNNINASQLDTTYIAVLTVIMNNQLPQISAYARGLLFTGSHIAYTEDIVLPDNMKASRAYANDRPASEETNNRLTIMPNPTKDYVIIGYDISQKNGQGIILIRDIRGVLLKNIGLQQPINQITVDVSDFHPGTYVVSVYAGNKLLESGQLSISK